MIDKLIKNKVTISFIFSLLFVYILLFEFILPINKVLPKPSILIESVPSLFIEYNFLNALTLSISVIYLTLLISYFLIKLSKNILVVFSNNFPKSHELLKISRYFMPLFLILLFELWFQESIFGEILFILILSMGSLKSAFLFELQNIKSEYLYSAKSLGLNENEIIDKVIWKSIQPKIFESISQNHVYLWSWILVYEFISKTDGIGALLYTALKYNDFSLILVAIIFIVITILIMNFVFLNIKKKFFFWE